MADRLRVLILEDQPDDVELIVAELRRAGFDPDWQRVDTEAEYLGRLRPDLDVILADYSMPAYDAMRALARLQERGLDVPFIIVTGSISEEVAVECMKRGAADYLLKDRLTRLGPAVTQTLEQKRLRAEKQQAEEALRQSEARYRQLLENASDVVYSHDLDLNFLSINPAGARLAGYRRDEILGRNLARFVAPDQLDKARLMLQCNVAEGGATMYELEAVVKDGRRVTLEVNSQLLYRNEKPVEVLGIARDITARKQAEKAAIFRADIGLALARSDSVRSTLQRCAESVVRAFDAAFARIWTLNETENMLELQASAGMYTHIDGGHSRVPVGQYKIGLIAQEKQAHLTNTVIGDPRVHDQEWAKREEMVAFAGYPLLVEGRTVGVLALFARKPLAEAALDNLAHAADLIAQFIERKWADDQVLASLREKEFLLAEIHHRVKNNLQIVYSLLNLQMAGVKEPAIRDVLRESQNRVQAMALIHENLYQSGNLAQLEFAAHVESLCSYLFESHGVHTQQVQLALRIEDVQIDLDHAVLLGLIINELVSNALKHAFPGGRRGQILVVFHDQQEGKYSLVVRDDGVGLPPDLDVRRTNTLGWQLVSGLTQQLGGTLTVECDQGTTITITVSRKGLGGDTCPPLQTACHS